MNPDFSNKTIETLAKRAGFCCSNPDCGVSTIGPNSDPNKATLIGEAAHIRGARAGSARYVAEMSDAARGEITNAIWLCRNCHKKVDHDTGLYPEDLLFKWREEHEKRIASKLRNKSDLVRAELEGELLSEFSQYPPVVRRIVIDKPPGWEWRLTAELLRHLNRPLFRQLEDLRRGYYTHPLETIPDEEVIEWMRSRMAEMTSLVGPMESLLDRLTASWGELGEAGDIEEIHHTCRLIHENLRQIVHHEERTRFVRVSEEFERLVSLLQDCLGSQADKFSVIPDKLDHIVENIDELTSGQGDEPVIVTETIELSLPKNWNREMAREIRKVERVLKSNIQDRSGISSFLNGCFIFIIVFFILIWILL